MVSGSRVTKRKGGTRSLKKAPLKEEGGGNPVITACFMVINDERNRGTRECSNGSARIGGSICKKKSLRAERCIGHQRGEIERNYEGKRQRPVKQTGEGGEKSLPGHDIRKDRDHSRGCSRKPGDSSTKDLPGERTSLPCKETQSREEKKTGGKRHSGKEDFNPDHLRQKGVNGNNCVPSWKPSAFLNLERSQKGACKGSTSAPRKSRDSPISTKKGRVKGKKRSATLF